MKTRVFIGLAIGNFLYQALSSGDYSKSFEVSFYMGTAILIVYLSERLNGESIK